jgi:glycosyltransferase involved in cell wall biosynthesis
LRATPHFETIDIHMTASSTPRRRPIRVLFILNSLCMGGAEKQVVSLVNGLDTSRFAVSVMYAKDNRALLEQIDASQCADGIECLDVRKGVEWHAVRRVARHIDEKGVDVVLCTNMYALLYGWLARQVCRRPVKIMEVFHTTDIATRKERLSMHVYRPLVRMADLLVYVCQGQARHWRERGLRARQETVIYNGIDTVRFEDRWSADEKRTLRAQYGLGADDYVVGLCAVMRPEKAHADLLTAIAALRSQGQRVTCLLIGDGPERGAIEKRIVELGLQDSVRITGFLQDVRPAIVACDTMVLASHAIETFSIAALEAMALGKPMVLTDIGGAREQVLHGENGFLYPVGDTNALADCLSALAEPDASRLAGAKAAARVRDTFAIDRMVEGYERVFDALVAGMPVAGDAGAQMRHACS